VTLTLNLASWLMPPPEAVTVTSLPSTTGAPSSAFRVNLPSSLSLGIFRSLSTTLTLSGRLENLMSTGSVNFSREILTVTLCESPCLIEVAFGAVTVSFLPPSPSPVLVSPFLQPELLTVSVAIKQKLANTQSHFIDVILLPCGYGRNV